MDSDGNRKIRGSCQKLIVVVERDRDKIVKSTESKVTRLIQRKVNHFTKSRCGRDNIKITVCQSTEPKNGKADKKNTVARDNSISRCCCRRIEYEEG